MNAVLLLFLSFVGTPLPEASCGLSGHSPWRRDLPLTGAAKHKARKGRGDEVPFVRPGTIVERDLGE